MKGCLDGGIILISLFLAISLSAFCNYWHKHSCDRKSLNAGQASNGTMLAKERSCCCSYWRQSEEDAEALREANVGLSLGNQGTDATARILSSWMITLLP